MCFQRSLLVLVLATVALALPTTSTARRSGLTACDLIPNAKLAAILGVQHVQIQRDIPGTSAKDNVDGVTHSVCNGLAWSGAAPGSGASALLAVASGRAAAFALDTWTPDEKSSYVGRWTDKGFEAYVNGEAKGVLTLPGLPPFKPYQARRLKPTGGKAKVENATGLTGTPGAAMSAIRAANGTWWGFTSFEIVSITFAGSADNPTVNQLNQIAAVAVAAFGLKALPLH